jgi:pimeloyl-ACP methyl ester carboxylesterase
MVSTAHPGTHQDVPRQPAAERQALITADGVRLSAAHWPARSGSRATAFVVAHGFSGSWRSTGIAGVVAALRERGGVVALDFRGHGSSTGESTLGDREIEDLAAAVAWARLLGYASVVTVGFSMGASIVVRHAALVGGVDAVVSVSGPSRWYYRGTPAMRRLHWLVEQRSGRRLARFAMRTRIVDAGWDPVPQEPRAVAAAIAPVRLLVVHGDADRFFPVEHAEELAAGAGPTADLWIEAGFGHAEAAIAPDLTARIAGWALDAVAAGDG